MPPEKAEVLREWLRKAGQDLAVSELILTTQPQFAEAAAFHSQQAAEKSLKAFLTFHDVRFRKIHNMKEIGNLILKIEPSFGPLLKRAERLTPFAVGTRYPGEDLPVTAEEARGLFVIAKEVCERVLKLLPKTVHPKAD